MSASATRLDVAADAAATASMLGPSGVCAMSGLRDDAPHR